MMPISNYEPCIARFASLLADASRARMLTYLLGGEYACASELAKTANVSSATASGHLSKLLDAGLLVCEPRGRHRYYRIADADVAHALEALAMVAERGSHSRLWSSPAKIRLRCARRCYGHMAGRLGVAVFQAMLERHWLINIDERGFALTDEGAGALTAIGMDGVAYCCMDWSERRDHLAGQLARALLEHFVTQDWLRKRPADRSMEITPPGRSMLKTWIQWESDQ
jgi:DNA-binding transcriptional ArsR family regulator